MENRFFALCTLHCDVNDRRGTHPFAFSPDGSELSARQAGSDVVRPLSECREAGNIYMLELDMDAVGAPPELVDAPARRVAEASREWHYQHNRPH